jgi:hypothetical protein
MLNLMNTATNLKEKLKRMYQKGDLKQRSYSANKKNELLQSQAHLSSTINNKKTVIDDEQASLSQSHNSVNKKPFYIDKRLNLDKSLGKIKEETDGHKSSRYNFDKNFFNEEGNSQKQSAPKYDILNKTKNIINNNKKNKIINSSTEQQNKGTTIIINNNININNYVTKQYYQESYIRPESTTNKLYNKYMNKDITMNRINKQIYSKKTNKYSNDNITGHLYDYKHNYDYQPYNYSNIGTTKNLTSFQGNNKSQSSLSNTLYKNDSYSALYKKYQKPQNYNLY